MAKNAAISQRTAYAVHDQYRLVPQIIGDQKHDDDEEETRVSTDRVYVLRRL